MATTDSFFGLGDDGLSLPDRRAGEEREYGFVIVSSRTAVTRAWDPGYPFGIIHADIRDPHIQGWIKTLTWDTTSPKWWRYEMDKRRGVGLFELPMVAGARWESDYGRRIAEKELATLKEAVRAYFEADRDGQFWEMGLEENLTERFRQPFYWSNLERKLSAVRDAARQAGRDIKVIYQLAELRLADISAFLHSKAVHHCDILSLHPYAWPRFPTPEEWLTDFLSDVQRLKKTHGAELPIWFTEVGAPQHIDRRGGRFRSPAVRGQSAEEAVTYIVKLHVLALHHGVEKVFWYNYQDRGSDRGDPEDHFGIRDFWGYPKPTYGAYINLQRLMGDKSPISERKASDDLWLYEFHGKDEDLLVAWTQPAAEKNVPWSVLRRGLSSKEIVQVSNAVGTPMPIANNTVRISGDPIFVVLKPR